AVHIGDVARIKLRERARVRLDVLQQRRIAATLVTAVDAIVRHCPYIARNGRDVSDRRRTPCRSSLSHERRRGSAPRRKLSWIRPAGSDYAEAMSIETPEELEQLKAAGRVVANAIRAMQAGARPGVTTGELDEIGARVFAQAGARSGPQLDYGFPGVNCI